MENKSHSPSIRKMKNDAQGGETNSLQNETKIDLKDSLFLIIIFALIAIFYSFWTISAQGLLPGDNRDIISESISAASLVKSILEYHQFPLWNNYWITGLPEYASSASTFYYPFATLFYLAFGTPDAYHYIIPFHLFLSAFAFWLFSSTITTNKSIRLYGSVAYMLSGAISAKINMGHMAMFMAHPYVPLSMFFLIKAYSTKNIKYMILSALSMSMIMFTGAIYFVVFFMFLFVVYAFTKIVDVDDLINKKIYIDKNNIKTSVGIFILFIMLSAVKLIPTLLFVGNIVRIDPIDPLEGGILFKDAVTFFLTSGGWERDFYLGFIPLSLAIVSIFHKSKERYYIYIGIFVFLIWASVKNSFFWWIHLFPVLDSMRVPFRSLGFVSFLLIALAMYGFEIISDTCENSIKSRNLIILSVLFLIFFEMQEFVLNFMVGYNGGARIGIVLTVSIFLIASWVFIQKNNWNINTKKIVFVMMSFTVLALVMNNIVLTAPEENPLNDPTVPEIMQAIKDNNVGANTQIWVSTNGWPYQHQEFAYHAVKNDIHIVRAYYSYFLKTMPFSINIGNQMYYVANYLIDTQYLETGVKADIAGMEKITEINGVSVYKIENSLPNAFIVNGNDIQSLPIKYFSPNKVIVDGSKIGQGDLVILKAAYYNGWKASGKPAINTGNMVATTAESSNEDITFYFDPIDFKIGFAISLITLLCCIIILLRKGRVSI
ncbi:MAG: YfhO family protein [Methanosarcinaceae archaeon]|nr:YfhO family protein [Methanosarcinaceae archaeon]